MPKRVPPLSPAALASVKPDPSRTIELVDGAEPGLRLRISPSGHRAWSLNMRARGVMRRFEVGVELGLSEARKKAKSMRHDIANGADPTEKKREKRMQSVLAKQGIGTFVALIDAYFQTGTGASLKTGNEQAKRIKSVFAAQLAKPAMTITSTELQHAIDRHPAQVASARATAYLRPVIKWATRRGLMQGAFDLEKPLLSSPKQRVLTATELAALLPSWTDNYGRCCHFLLLTGARLDEARNARWEHFDLESATWTIPAEQRKDTRAQARRRAAAKDALVIPLSRQTLTLLTEIQSHEWARRKANDQEAKIASSDLVFVGDRGGRLANWDRWLKGNARKTEISGWSAHALRRTTATLAGDLGMPPHIVSVILGHTNIGGQLIAGYNKSRYRDEHCQGLQAVADLLQCVRDPVGAQ